jgi:hypothetical protein
LNKSRKQKGVVEMVATSFARKFAVIVATSVFIVAVLGLLPPQAGAGTSTQVVVTNTSSDPVPITGTVHTAQSGGWNVGINGQVKTRPAIPPTAFHSFTRGDDLTYADIAGPSRGNAPYPATTRWALTSVVAANLQDVDDDVLLGYWLPPSLGCTAYKSEDPVTPFTELFVPAHSTASESFSVPLTTPDLSSSNKPICLVAVGKVSLTVIGFTF